MTISSNTNDSPAAFLSEEINFGELLDNLLQRIWLVVAVFLFTILVGLSYALLATPIYRADALIQVEDQKPSAISGVQAISEALGGGMNSVAGEVEILRSREVVLKAIAATNSDITIEVKNRFPLLGDWYARRQENAEQPVSPILGLKSYSWGGEQISISEFAVPSTLFGRQLTLVAKKAGYDIQDEHGKILGHGVVGQIARFQILGIEARLVVSRLSANAGTQFEVAKISPVDAYRSVLTDLNVGEASRQSNIIRVRYEHPSIERANALVNAIARAYLTQNVERRSAEATQRLDFLDKQLPQIKKNVEQAEEALNKFRTKTNTINVEKSTEALLSQAIQVEKGRLELELQRDALLQRYQPSHPAVKAIDDQLAATRRATDRVNDEVNSLPAAQRDLLRLQRDADVSGQLYIALMNDVQQLRVAKAGTVGNVRIIDYAIPDTQPVAPRKTMIVGVAGFLGIMLGILAAFALRSLRPTIRDAEELERSTALSVYATIPESALQKRLDSHRRGKSKGPILRGMTQLLATLHPEDPAVESLRSLRTGLAFALIGAENKNIVITGPTAALGKSFVSANLSALVASTGKKVLLIETDLRRPQLGRYFGYENAPGLSNVLAGSTTFDEAILVKPEPTLDLDVLPSGTTPPNPGELLLGESFKHLLEEAGRRYDHVILDSAPILPVADTLAVAQHAATVFFVARSEQSTARELRDALHKLESVGIHVKGIIFNGVKRHRVGSSYAYKYYYGYGDK